MEDVNLNEDSPQEISLTNAVNNEYFGTSSSALPDEGAPDPRIQVELEKLNTSTDTINKLEVDLDEARMLFRQLLSESTQRIDMLAKRLGKCVEQSRPYYDARIRAKQALSETQVAAARYERAMSQHAAAREMVFLAEEGLMQKGCTFDHTWQEMLNHATSKVNDAEKEKIESAAEHRKTSAYYHETETRVKSLQKELKRAIAKSSLNARRSLLQLNNLARMHQLQLLPYFELKAAVNQQLEAQKQRVRQLEESVTGAKVTYAQALANLETISDEIHRTRQSQLDLGVRGVGVGAESPLPPHQAADAGLPLTANPLHYAGSSLDSDTQEEYKALPSKLGPASSPIVSSMVIGLGNPALSSSHYLNVEDRDSTISDNESLASIEMLSDEAIAGLMLDEELAEASNAMGTPLNTPLSELPVSSSSVSCPWPSVVQDFSTPSTSQQATETTCTVSDSMTLLQIDDPFHPVTRQVKPPKSLPLSNDSSSEHSSPEDLTPGYVPLQNSYTPYTPEEFLSPPTLQGTNKTDTNTKQP